MRALAAAAEGLAVEPRPNYGLVGDKVGCPVLSGTVKKISIILDESDHFRPGM